MFQAVESTQMRLLLKSFESQVLFSPSAWNHEELPVCFESIEQYIVKFYQLLLEEARSDLISTYASSVVDDKQYNVRVQRTWTENHGRLLELVAGSPLSLFEGTLVVLSRSKVASASYSAINHSHLTAIVTHIHPCCTKFEVRFVSSIQVASEIPSRYTDDVDRLVTSTTLWIIPTCRLSSHLRCRDALSTLMAASKNFRKQLILPITCKIDVSTSEVLTRLGLAGTKLLVTLKETLNPPQFGALTCCLSSIFCQPFKNKARTELSNYFTLIQGPPGTGKTKVIVRLFHSSSTGKLISPQVTLTNVLHLLYFQQYFQGLDEIIQFERDASQKRKRSDQGMLEVHEPKPRILICAPSNAAVDNIIQRLVESGFSQMDGSHYVPDIIRLSSGDACLTATAKVFSVEPRVQALMNMSTAEWSAWYSRQYHTIAATEGRIKDMLKSNSHNSGIFDLYEVRDRALGDLARLERLRGLHAKSISGTLDWRHRQRIIDDITMSFIDEAEIVCCTLSSVNARRAFSASKPFKTIIVDEACQANELTTLIPLSYNQTHCVLVGDPLQLPATVKSKVAKDAQFDRSLFERLVFAGIQVNFLSVQFRMHSEIRAYPSAAFYGDRLVDAAVVETNRQSIHHIYWPFKPYAVFDIKHGMEQRSSNFSCYNQTEVSFIIRLILRYLKLNLCNEKRKIVVLSAYKAQCRLLQGKLQENGISTFVDVSTVDAFQGQESDIIILSCVRTSMDDIGFLADTRRLNVALTRARFSLWVVCNSAAVSKVPFWKNLLKDASTRGCLIPAKQVSNETTR